VVLVFRDVTDLRKREAALMAHEKLAVAGRLSASIAHEIHNPLDSVANLHYLMEKESDPALQQRYLAMAQQELNRTLQISRAMLGLYREPKAPVEVNLRDLLQSVLLLLDRQLKDQSVAVERKLEEDASIQGFPGELRQVFTNLITNAAEAAGPGGRVQVLLEDSAPADSRAGATVTITDSGPGILASHQNKLFKPFFTTKGEFGTGLGLWVSRGIVEKHGGTIDLSNSTDPALPGAAVRVYLPSLGPASVMATRTGNHHSTDALPENGDGHSQRSNAPHGHTELV
jgi:signal transduction histidine kinase